MEIAVVDDNALPPDVDASKAVSGNLISDNYFSRLTTVIIPG
jgi:hypothetical protein